MNTYPPEENIFLQKICMMKKELKFFCYMVKSNSGGSDIWVNNFLKEVWTKLPSKKIIGY